MNRRTFLSTAIASSAVSLAGAAESKVRVGQIGTQHAHAAGKMEGLRKLSGLYEVVGIANADEKAGKDYEGLPRLSEEQLLASPGLQAVTIETEVGHSCATALRAIRAGKHVHLDKPGALDHGEFVAMRNEAEKRQLTVQMGYMLRYNPAFQLLFKAKREGWLGEIREIDAMIGKLADARVLKQIGSLPGGGMFELGCHVIDAAMTLLGKPNEVHAFSTPSNDDGVKDNQLAVLVYGRATVTIRCNHADPFGGPRRRFTVAGSKGAMEIIPLESGQATLFLDAAHGEWKKGQQQVKLDVPKGRYDNDLTDFAKVVRGEKTFDWSAAHDIAVHETVMRAAGQNV
ncbi:MAG: hypothetical protein JWO89_79 [Verrucomicrobiaceae bacterium]|nr:hypothetical protein [Verrucomicrobiaceae bacterium]